MNRMILGLFLLTGAGRPLAAVEAAPQVAETMVWRFDNLRRIGGRDVEVAGNPKVVDTDVGKAVRFDGKGDGLFFPVNPIRGARTFTVEILFYPDGDGPAAQRFFHIQENGTTHRALLETRVTPDHHWYLDTFLGSAAVARQPLIDPQKQHPADSWHTVALVYDGKTMTHYVDGVEECTIPLRFSPLDAGRTSAGVRINRAYWFKGMIAEVRITRAALTPPELLRVPRKAVN